MFFDVFLVFFFAWLRSGGVFFGLRRRCFFWGVFYIDHMFSGGFLDVFP